MKRREVVQALLTPDPVEHPEGEPSTRAASGAVRAMGLEMDRLAESARTADTLRQQIESGMMVVDLPPELVDPSFVSDRLSRGADPEFRRLVESFRASGQQVPILVRPHPQAEGRYQIAYGHRRRDAAAELGIAVRAIVRPLTDAQLVVAQGKENGERQSLTFIERALFAADLHRRGFDRPTLHGALGVQSAEMTRLLAVAAAIPEEVIRKIGPAPKAGRFRWRELARDLTHPGITERVTEVLAQPSVQSLTSDRRFVAVLDAIRAGNGVGQAGETIADSRGVVVVRIERSAASVRVTFDERAAPGLGNMAIRDLPLLVGRYSAGHR
jgi:ParB family chromosome partitioning protein